MQYTLFSMHTLADVSTAEYVKFKMQPIFITVY